MKNFQNLMRKQEKKLKRCINKKPPNSVKIQEENQKMFLTS